jgi:hypothetical protein
MRFMQSVDKGSVPKGGIGGSRGVHSHAASVNVAVHFVVVVEPAGD